MYLQKLVSHRLRGFGSTENGRAALVAACASGASVLEVDSRVSRDGTIFVHHNPRPDTSGPARRPFARSDAHALRRARYRGGEPLVELSDALAVFRREAPSEQRLWIDLKDFGFEREHLELVRGSGLDERVGWVSWIPESLRRIHACGGRGPLILGHCNLGGLGRLGDAVSTGMRKRSWRFSRVVVRGAHHGLRAPERYAHGFQHGVVCTRLPGPLEALLQASGGGVCVHWSLMSSRLIRYCEQMGLTLTVFKVGSVRRYLRWARHPGVGAVFCDDAPAVLAAARSARRSPLWWGSPAVPVARFGRLGYP